MDEWRQNKISALVNCKGLVAMPYSKGRFTIDEIEFIQNATVKVLVAVSHRELDLNLIAQQELAQRGLNQNGVWVGFKRAREAQVNIETERRSGGGSLETDP